LIKQLAGLAVLHELGPRLNEALPCNFLCESGSMNCKVCLVALWWVCSQGRLQYRTSADIGLQRAGRLAGSQTEASKDVQPWLYLPPPPLPPRSKVLEVPRHPLVLPPLDRLVLGVQPSLSPPTAVPGLITSVPPKGFEGWYMKPTEVLVPGWAQGASDWWFRYFMPCAKGPKPCPYTMPPMPATTIYVPATGAPGSAPGPAPAGANLAAPATAAMTTTMAGQMALSLFGTTTASLGTTTLPVARGPTTAAATTVSPGSTTRASGAATTTPIPGATTLQASTTHGGSGTATGLPATTTPVTSGAATTTQNLVATTLQAGTTIGLPATTTRLGAMATAQRGGMTTTHLGTAATTTYRASLTALPGATTTLNALATTPFR